MPYSMTWYQRDVLCITAELAAQGITPTLEAIRNEMDVPSKAQITLALDELEARGWIARLRYPTGYRIAGAVEFLHPVPTIEVDARPQLSVTEVGLATCRSASRALIDPRRTETIDA